MDAPLARGEQGLDDVAVPRAFAVALVAAAILAPGCFGGDDDGDRAEFVQRADSRLVKVQTVGLAALGPINPHTATPPDAEAAFGRPSSMERRGARCMGHWRDLGLTIEFGAPGGDDPCGAGAGIVAIRVAGRAAEAARWRTAEGIRPGMSVAAARRIYPEARGTGGRRLVLVRGPSGPESGPLVTVLAVETAAGTVTGMMFPIAE